jgi:Xaa-Pro aminopeptidase
MNVFEERCQRTQKKMATGAVDWLFVPHSTDLKYLIGHAHRQSERLTLLMLPREGRPLMVLPTFETPQMENYATFFDLVGWQETENPIEKIGQAVGGSGAGQTVAIGDQLHSVFLLRIQSRLPDAHYLPGGDIVGQLRMIKDADGIANLRAAAEGADRSLAALFEQPLLEMTELDVIQFLHAQLLENGHESVGTGIVGAGANGAAPHHKTSERPLKGDEAVVVDFGGGLNGYRSDMTRTFHLGKPSDEFRKVYEIVRAAQQKAFEAIRPGVTAESIDRVARQYIGEHGYGEYFLHRTGHGIGLDGHERPYIVEGDKTVLEKGMTFSVEPGIYLKGKFGVRIEDIVAVTEDGAERLNQFPRDLKIVNGR